MAQTSALATPTTPHDELTPEQRRQQLIRAVVASAVGTTIEWYDFFLYGVAAALVFPTRLFAETMDPFIA